MLESVPPAPAGRRDDPAVAIFLGLYLLLLAFFILLNTIATIDEAKAQAVMHSLNATFASRPPSPAGTRPLTTHVDHVVMAEDLERDLLRIFAEAIPLARIEILRSGRVLEIALSQDALFETGSPALRERAGALLDQVAAALALRPPGLGYGIEAVLGVAPASEGAASLPVLRAGSLARALVARGLPPASVSIGLEDGGGDRLALRFRPAAAP